MDAASLQSEQLLCSQDHRSSMDAEAKELPGIPPKDSAKKFTKAPLKKNRKAWHRKGNRRSMGFSSKSVTDVHQDPCALEVDRYYYQINWPEVVLQKWAMEKANLEKNLSVLISEDSAVVISDKLDIDPGDSAMEGDSWDVTEMVSK